MLVVMAERIGVDLGQVVQLVAVYSLAYALGQPLWGIVSDRVGRTSVLSLALAGAVLGSAASILIPGFLPLVISRAFTGLCVGALYPTVLTILGDALQGPSRAREISIMQTSSALGTTVATLIAGSIALWLDWRVIFGITLVSAAVVFLRIRGTGDRHATRPPRSLGAAFSVWPVVLYVFAFLEGMAFLGALTYIVPAMEYGGIAVEVAGVLAAIYGVGIILGSLSMARLVARFSRPVLIVAGGIALTAAWLIATVAVSGVWLTATAFLVGLGNSFLHSSVQAWVTEVSPQARATTISLFATSLFLGAGAATALTAEWADYAAYREIFLITTVISFVVSVAAALGYVLWSRSRST